jgi:hypothetical protein
MTSHFNIDEAQFTRESGVAGDLFWGSPVKAKK